MSLTFRPILPWHGDGDLFTRFLSVDPWVADRSRRGVLMAEYNPNNQGWGAAAATCILTAALGFTAFTIHKNTYRHPRDPMTVQVYHAEDMAAGEHGGEHKAEGAKAEGAKAEGAAAEHTTGEAAKTEPAKAESPAKH